ncbi:MAG TPA: DUF6765 family protein, partial [Povalibacter sp.]
MNRGMVPLARTCQHGSAIVETVIALPILLVVILGAIQFGLIYEAKATLNHASLQAARAGAVNNAQPEALRSGLASGLAPLYSPDSSLAGVASTVARINTELLTDARIRILNPTREAFEDFAEEVDGVREIPNDRLHARSTTIGAQSGINIQDANILRVEITYGYELKVPLVNWFISRVLLGVRRGNATDAFGQQLLRRTRLPIVATATVRMQSPARMSDAVVAREDFPEIERIPADARPPDDTDEDSPEQDESDGSSAAGNDDGSNLADGFFGFGEGHGDGSGGGSTPGGGSGSGSGGGTGGGNGGGNSGNPASCSGNGEGASPAPVPSAESPVLQPQPLLFSRDGASASSISLPSTLPSVSVGNPIHVVTGNKYQSEADLHSLPGSLPLEFVRHYNSQASGHAGMMGAGWRHSYEASLRVEGSTLEIWQPDGRHLRFVGSDASDRFDGQRASDGNVLRVREGYRWRWPTGRELQFDAKGRLWSVRDRASHIVLTYNERGRLDRVTDSQQRELRFEHFPNGRISRVIAPAGMEWRYFYDDAGNLAYVVAADGRARRYDYADVRHPHHLTAVSAGMVKLMSYGDAVAFSQLARWEYDEQGRGILSSHPNDAGKVQLRYGDGYTDVTDAFGRVSRYVTEFRDGIALVREIRGPGCSTCGRGNTRYEFADAFQLGEMRAKQGPSMRYRYDHEQRLQSVERDAGSSYELVARYRYSGDLDRPTRIEMPSVKPGESRSVTLEWNNDELKSMAERGYTPEPDGRFTRVERATRFGYDGAGALVSIDGPRDDVRDISRLTYDARHRLVHAQTAGGAEYRVDDFDAAGRPTLIRRTGQPAIRLRYDVGGYLIEVTELRRAGERHVEYRYDAVGRLEQIVDADGRVQRIGHDAAGRPDRFTSEETGLAAALKYAPDGNVATAAILSRSGTPVRWLRYVYDDRRRLKEIRDGDGPALRELFYREEDSQPHSVVDALGYATEFSYDVSGFVRSVTAADKGVTRLDRDASGQLREVIAPNGTRTSYVHDDLGRRTAEHSADRGTTHYSYDLAGNVRSKTDARGQVIRFIYDADNRVTAIADSEGATTISYREGRIATVESPGSREIFKYGADGELLQHIREISGNRFLTAYTYNESGRMETRTLPSGQRLRYHYAPGGALRAIARDGVFTDPFIAGQPDVDGFIDASGQLAYGNGFVLRNIYDLASGRLARRMTPGLGAIAYRYDEAGHLAEVDEGNAFRSYRYDAIGRLGSASTPLGHFRFAYDENGNRLSETVQALPRAHRRGRAENPTTTEFQYTAQSNLLLQDAAQSMRDAAGNLTQSSGRRYDYSSGGRPLRLFIDGTLAASYRYNAQGERIAKTIYKRTDQETTFYLYENHQLVAEADGSGKIAREYLYSDHHPIAMLEGQSTFWIHTDHLGTPRAVTDAARQVVWKADYEPFGAAHIDSDPDRDGKGVTLNLRFPGQYEDSESGTYYNLMRDYDPQTGRYLTPDPLGLADGTNPFAYVHGNPISGVDRFGLYDEMVHYYMTYFLALVAGVPQDVARTMAIATQYVDANYQTQPVHTLITNAAALPLYHFVLDYEQGFQGDSN